MAQYYFARNKAPVGIWQMDLDHPSKQEVDLSLDQDELSNLTFSVSATQKVGTAGRARLVEVELHHLGGNGAQLANIQLRSEQSARKSVGDVEHVTHVGLTSDLMSRVSRCAGVSDLRSGIISANSLNVALISHTSSPCLARL